MIEGSLLQTSEWKLRSNEIGGEVCKLPSMFQKIYNLENIFMNKSDGIQSVE